MFFDCLFTLTPLKARLLGSSSFAQLYSAERLPLHKFRREGAMLSPLIAGLLAACGGGGGGPIPGPRTTETVIIREDGDDDDDGPGPTGGPEDDGVPTIGNNDPRSPLATTTLASKASDIKGAVFYIDPNSDGVLDGTEKTEANRLGMSDDNGQARISNERLIKAFEDHGTDNGKLLSIVADLSGAVNVDTGEVYTDGSTQHTVISLTALGTLQVLSSITTIVEQLKENGLSESDALKAIFGKDTDITAEVIMSINAFFIVRETVEQA